MKPGPGRAGLGKFTGQQAVKTAALFATTSPMFDAFLANLGRTVESGQSSALAGGALPKTGQAALWPPSTSAIQWPAQTSVVSKLCPGIS